MNIAVFQYINSFAGISPISDWLIIFAADYLWMVMSAAVLIFAFVSIHGRFRAHARVRANLVLHVVLSVLLAHMLTTTIRMFYDSPRPFEVVDGAVQLVSHTAGHAFPSAHTALAFAMAGAITIFYPKAGRWFLIGAAFMGIGRIAAGIHWPIDILAGTIVGIVAAYAAKYTISKFYHKISILK
jgi:undecaprenyl-diphosphatase